MEEKEKWETTTTNGEKPIYPTTQKDVCHGMTLREYYAGLAMQTFIQAMPDISIELAAKASVAHATELLRALQEKESEKTDNCPTEEKETVRGAANGLSEEEKDAIFAKVADLLQHVVSTLDSIGESVGK